LGAGGGAADYLRDHRHHGGYQAQEAGVSFRKVLAWLFVLAVAAGSYFYTAHEAEQTERQEKAASKALSLSDPLNVQAIELSGEDYPKPVRIERRDAEHKWQMVEPVDWTADGVRVGNLLDALLGIHRQRTLQKQDNPAEFGLKPPRVLVKLWDRKGGTAELLVGDESPTREFFYAAPPDSKGEVWLLPGKERRQISLTLFDLRDKSALEFVVANVKDIKLEQAAGDEISLQRKGKGEKAAWSFTNGEKASAEDVRDWLFQIHGIRAMDFVDTGIDEKAMGLTQPVTRLTLGMADGSRLGLSRGKKAKTGAESYVRRLAGGPVLVVKDKGLAVLNKSSKDLAYRKVWELVRQEVIALDISGPKGKTRSYAKDEGKWRQTKPPGKEKEATAAALFVYDLASLKYEQILDGKGDYGLDAPEWKIVVKERQGYKPDQIRAYTLIIGKIAGNNALLPAKVQGDPRVFGLNPDLLKSIPVGDAPAPPKGG
jgi:hypothetical protein